MADDSAESILDVVQLRFPVGALPGMAEFRRFLADLGIPDSPAVTAAVEGAVREWSGESSYLAFEPGGWKVSITGPAVHAAISAAMIWGALTALNIAAPLPLVLVPAIIPRMFVIERVRLTRKEKETALLLAMSKDARTGTAHELYSKLPQEIQDELGFSDFCELLEKIVNAGKAQEKGSGTYEIFGEGESRFRVVFE